MMHGHSPGEIQEYAYRDLELLALVASEQQRVSGGES